MREETEPMSVGQLTVDKWMRQLRHEREGSVIQGSPTLAKSNLYNLPYENG